MTIVEVGPRDGFQSIGPFIPTATKIALIGRLHDAGLRRMEITSFVSPSALPQLADAEDVVSAAATLHDLDSQVLVPTLRHAERALAAGARHLSAVLSVSERHNIGNVRRTPLESAADYAAIIAAASPDIRIRLNLATSFDCPHVGCIGEEAVLGLLEILLAATTDVEVALCDTTGRADPRHVRSLFASAQARFPEVSAWAFHGHDTFGLGAANALAAWDAGVRVFDAAIAGLGGCPFAPGATGNVATEDLVWMFSRMGADTGIELDRLLAVARNVADLPGAQVGGRVRQAMEARACLAVAQ
ncbi:hydroxymethylglutaryl-CoA lyase [Novosphingobium sp. JCM 18896]|uniref:hydroxymethylglutaryl-CoA lyase n=1 Tax=Novosphingobium sp. JCM 18896 TaxID=2989731 RepID=UPI00222227B4|nr:hydroxymethylglutaryl-CoA lyase [Novosphingobium sp. JCM 18896]MCW1432272.1 hydroxymethylglutaryl-CoA lyase [Novosphingobium sp. JCM 18896]